MDIIVGKVFLGRYRLKRELGRGSFGKVIEAIDMGDNSRVALKISIVKDNDYRKDRSNNEALILKALKDIDCNHRKLVVDLKAHYILEERVVLVLELLSHSLTKSIKMGTIGDMSKISILAKQMVDFLCFMSRAEAIHGDIKPDNILHELEGDGIKFADFGLSHCPLFKTKSKFLQTLGYMAPEVILGFDYDSSIDIWSVGCVLFECLTGKRLFRAMTKLQMLQEIAKIVGTLAQETIINAPNREMYYSYDTKSEMWVLDGFTPPTGPSIGLSDYFLLSFGVDIYDPRCNSLINLIRGMLRLNPRDRCTPRDCLEHPFFVNNDKLQPSHEFDEIVECKDLCHEIGPLEESLTGEAEDLGKVGNDGAAGKKNRKSKVRFSKTFKGTFSAMCCGL